MTDTGNRAAGQPNKLADETSPYLLQHAYNPVAWYPWGDEALARAQAEDKPIFLSIGYSACHWCHVMERESFENPAIAAFLNEHFVSIKVDREERPDLDEIYMTAVQALTGRGGWPMSVFLTPDLKPFYGGTYFPPEDRMGMPGFLSLLRALQHAWDEKRGEIVESADALTRHLADATAGDAETGQVAPQLLRDAAAQLHRAFDAADGGWGRAPKFPSAPSIALLLRAYRREQDPTLLHMATFTLDRMARGGIYDQIGGGFHRYSVDGQWLVPHFEKMLYDNAQLSQVYLEAYQLTGNPAYRRTAEETFAYVLRDLRDARGGFHSAEDADSEGEEGRFYLWTRAEILDVLGDDDGTLFCTCYNVHERGNFSSHEPYHRNQNILHLAQPAAEIARQLGMGTEELEARIAPLRERLRTHRAKRVRPLCDDKVLTSWNALMITALAQGAQVLGNASYRDAATEAGVFLLEHMLRGDTLLRTHRNGESRLPGYLDDYAFAANAFVDLYEATFSTHWLDAADRLARKLLAEFWDPETKSFYFTEAAHQHLIVRTKPTYDGAEPSGNSVAALALLRLAKLLGESRYADTAQSILEGIQPDVARAPMAFMKMLCAMDFFLYPPKEIALAGHLDAPDTQALLHTVHGVFLPNKVLALAEPGNDQVATRIPLLEGKVPLDGRAAAYVCRDYTCLAPTAAPERLAALLRD